MQQQDSFSLEYSFRGQPDLQQPKARNLPQGQLAALIKHRVDSENELYMELQLGRDHRPNSAPPDPHQFQLLTLTQQHEDHLNMMKTSNSWKNDTQLVSTPIYNPTCSSRQVWSNNKTIDHYHTTY
ncbi:uncharacterized protein BX663DRAFT_1859 [Cokeromyces recurvatus]|uniref:uncharacterized protein n=1 Tax=Cokeromyces recurvatus TaxID=90255 RepID=UPI00221FF67C|nr:uncharacterized protein BX663DRAFT_1859 [Cokeromyces recurvatus]KAI7907487.1 hypothetical protein BX663DRAFT_1859 [Cokeromyces recurvatus]